MVLVAIKLKMQQDNLWVIIDYLQIIVRLAVVMLQGYLHLDDRSEERRVRERV